MLHYIPVEGKVALVTGSTCGIGAVEGKVALVTGSTCGIGAVEGKVALVTGSTCGIGAVEGKVALVTGSTCGIGAVEGKVALVTGSTCGIGLAIAGRLAEAGCDVIITGIAEQKVIDGILKEFRSKYRGKFTYVGGDLSKEDTTNQMCNEIVSQYPGGIDVLVNNAGIQYVCQLTEYPVSKWNDMMAINLTAPFLLTKFFLPFMKIKGWGRIVNIASQMGLISTPGKVPYSASKSGLIGLTKGTALEVADRGVTCNAICPGFVETELVKVQIRKLAAEKSITYDEMKEEFFSQHPTKKPVTVEQVSGMVLYLCSEVAANVTGAALSIDAGYTAR